MYEQEKQRVTHLTVLLCYTILALGLTMESILLGWDLGAVMLILAGLVVCWGLHITEKIPEDIRQWIYVVLTMLTFFFYGIHESSIYDMATLMVVVIIMYISTEKYSIINLCMAVYFFMMFYDFVFIVGRTMEYTSLMVSRTMLHLMLVYMAGRLSKIIIRRRRLERKNTNDIVAALEETNRRTEDFLTNVSHELRTPINVVTGLTAVMLKTEEDREKRKNILSVQMAGHRLFSQIEDILDYTEIDTGRIKLTEDAYMISSIVNDIIAGTRMQERENAPELIFDIDAGIPSLLIGDRRKIKKIVKHLVDNAMKFTKKGGVYVRIYTLPKKYGVNLCIRVSDTGIGIDEDNLSEIKERFYQLNGGRNRRAGGLGLGIPIVCGMTTAMEGFLQIESIEEDGTTVSVSIPQKVADASPCLSIINRESLCLGCYLRPEKYAVPEIRSYYNETISHMVRGLDLVLHRVFNLEELEKLVSMYQLTHLFMGKEEYEENKEYFDRIDKDIEIVVIADDNLILPKRSRIKHIQKPFCCLPVVNMLNAGSVKDKDGFEKESMLCPGIRALVVDDEPMNLMVAEGILRDYQMQVKTAESGIKALELCDQEKFDLIFLDHMMPEMDGVETLKRLRKMYTEEGETLTIIAFTANAVSSAREMFLREGFDEFVSKPIEYLELERVLKKVLPKSSIVFVEKEGHDENRYADTAAERSTEIKTEEDLFSRLEKFGINIRAGLQYCRGDREFYRELLAKFAQDAPQKEQAINELWKKEDLMNYRIMVHALKSSAKMIGADFLSESARKAEEAAKNQDMDYIRAHHEELLTTYRETVLEMPQTPDPDSDSPQITVLGNGNGKQISGEEFLQRLNALKDSFDTFEADRAETLIAEMGSMVYEGMPVEELLRGIREDVDEFEFGKASGKVQALIDSMEGGGTDES